MDVATAAWRSTNVGALLFAANAHAVEIKLKLLRDRGFTITESQLALFHALDDAARPTELAARANLGKAAMAELIDRAVAMKLVERRDDPADRRGRIVVVTVAGEALRAALSAGIAAAERDAVNKLGATATAALRTMLGCYVVAPGAVRQRIPAGADAAWAAASVGRATGLAGQRFVAEVAAAVAGEGFDASPAILGMLRHLDLSGTRLTTLAARARMTKPAMAELVDRAARLGYVERTPDPIDGRARTIVFTPHGLALLDAVRRGILGAEAAMAEAAGPGFVAARASLACLAEPRSTPPATDTGRLSSTVICHRSGAPMSA